MARPAEDSSPEVQAFQQIYKKLQEMVAQTVSPITEISNSLQASLRPLYEVAAQAAMSDTLQALNELSERQTRFVQEIAASAFSQNIERLAASMKAMAASVHQMLQKAELSAQEVRPVFEGAGFWFVPSMPMHILWEVKRLKEQDDLSPNTLRRFILEYFREENSAALREVVEKWRSDPMFDPRMHIFEDALGAHLAGKYTLSIPALLPHVEGIAGCIVGVTPGSMKGILSDIKKVTQEETSFLAPVTGDAWVVEMDKSYEYLNFEDFHDKLEEMGCTEGQFLHRHAILHGVQVNYASEENSLRAFLLLDGLYELNRWENKIKEQDNKQRRH